MQLTGADAKLCEEICARPEWDRVRRLGVAVSGGGDSVALLHLLAKCAARRGVALEAATVDHGLRPEAAAEAQFVAHMCGALGLRHACLRWEGWHGAGNLQAEAREARYTLLAGWAQDRRLDAVAMAHTRDDQAETFLMRLTREAGVDGLAAMSGEFSRDGARFWRPVLEVPRATLRGFLTRQGLDWRDDPSNEDASYDRVKARQALETLETMGLSRAKIAGVASNLADASRALKWATADAAHRIARVEAGDVLIARDGFRSLDPEIARRLIVAGLVWVSSSDYPPRRASVAELLAAIRSGKAHTAHGCLVSIGGDAVRVSREPVAVAQTVVPFGEIWDRRWIVTGPADGGEIRALGEAVTQCPDWRETGLPRTTLLATPAIWRGETLVAAPLAGFENGFSATIDDSAGDFFTSILSH